MRWPRRSAGSQLIRPPRLESQAAAARAGQNAKITAAEAKEKAKRDDKAAQEREVAAGHAEAEAITQSLQARLTVLETLSASTLGEDPYLPWAAEGTQGERKGDKAPLCELPP